MNFKKVLKNTDNVFTFPFREGDVVRVVDWGRRYPTYFDAFDYFNMKQPIPFHPFSRDYPNTNPYFKVCGFVLHENGAQPLVHIKGRDFKEMVIGATGIEPFRVYPLRKGEKAIGTIERLGHLQDF